MSDKLSGLLPTNIALLQPAAQFFRLDQALQALNLTGNINTLQEQVAALQTDVTTLQGQVATLQSQMTTVQAQISALQLFMNSFNWQQVEQSTGLIFLDGRTLYTRSFVISGAVNTALNVFTYAHGVPNINYVAQAIGVCGQNAGTTYPITYLQAAQVPSVQDAISMIVDVTNIYILNGSQIRTNYLVLVKLYYTCTDR